MKNIFMKKCLIFVVLMVTMPVNSYALEVETHKAINEYIAQNSLNGFSLGAYLINQLGFENRINEKVNSLEVWKWLRDGGLYEDEPPWVIPYLRSVNHFHDPLTEEGFSGYFYGLLLSGDSSEVWAQKPKGAQSPLSDYILGGNYSWHDERDYFYKALTANNKTDRENNFAKTFRGIGQLMHLVEDASVPSHTRNDGHLAGYEKWVEKNIDIGTINPTFYDKSILGRPISGLPIANIFDTNQYSGTNPNVTIGNYIGLTEFTNANFFSEDTIFSDYPHPAKENTSAHLVERYAKDGKLDEVWYIQGYTSMALAAYSYFWDNSGLIPETKWLYNLDDFVYEDYASQLIPRAVGYSAGLLDYFFRGTLEITPPDQIAYAVTDGSQTPYVDDNENLHQQFTSIKAKVRNSTPDTIPGEEVQNCNQIQGNCIIQAIARYKIIPNYMYDLSNYPPDGATMHNIEYSYSVSEPIYIDSLDSTTPQEFSFDFTNDPIPAGITDLYLQVVFKGTLGNETDIAVAAGMKDLTEPTHQAFWNLTDMFSLNYHLYTSYDNPYTPEIDGIRNTPELANIVDFDHDTVLNPPDTGEPYIDPYPMTFGIGYLSGPPEQGGTFYYSAITTVQPGRHIRLIALMDKPQDNYLVLVQSDAISSTSYFYFTSPGVVNQEVNGIWQTPTPIVTFRYGLDGVTQIPIRQHFKTGVLRCYPIPYGNPACSYPEEEAIPAELSPSPIDDVYFYQAVFSDELATFETSAIETTGQTGVVVK